MNQAKFRLFLAGCAAYLASLALPAFSCGAGAPIYGYEILAWGWMGMVMGDPRWWANPIFLAVMIRVATAGNRPIHGAWFFLSFLAVALAGLSIILPAYVCLDAGTVTKHDGPMIGVFLWIAAMLAAAALALKQGD